jgi:putative chitinase
MVAEPLDACLTAAWFWSSIDGNLLADAAQWDALTRAVNGPACDQAERRRDLAVAALPVWAGQGWA